MSWPKGVPRKPKADSPDTGEVREATEQAKLDTVAAQDAVEEVAFGGIKDSGEPADKKLAAAYYDETYARSRWDADNPMAIPPDILKANPGMRFRYRAIDTKTGNLRGGDHYQGWQVYRSGKYPNGKVFGGDTILSFMPEEQAARINRDTQEASREQVRGLQEKQLSEVDRLLVVLKKHGIEGEHLGLGTSVQGDNRRSKPVGITIGASSVRDKKTGAVREQHRGYHPEELQEMAAKAAENRGKHRKYSFPGQTKRS